MYINPIFSIDVVKISQDSWFYFTKQVSFWMRDDSLWANGAKVWFFQGPFGEINCSWNLLFPRARSLWTHGGLPMDPIVTLQDINAVGRPCKTMAKIPKIIILGYSKGDSCQISPLKNVNNLLGSPINFLRRSCKVSTRLWVLTCLALGEPSLQLATCYSQKTHPPWISDSLHRGTQHRCHDVPIKNCALMGCLGGGSYETSEVGVAFAWIHIDLVTLVSLWRHCHLLSAQFQTTHFLVRLPMNRARRTLP